jgi:predicted metal-binding membrane protein
VTVAATGRKRGLPGVRWPVLPATVLATAGGAWLVLYLLGQQTGAVDHGGHLHGSHVDAGTGGAALTGWALMVVAMMLPPALPFLRMLQRLVARHRTRHRLVASGAGAFLAVWMAVGGLLVAGEGLFSAVATEAWQPAPQQLVGAVLVLAGAFQLSPLKRRCLSACRSPRSFAVAHWHGERRPAVEAATIGAAYGASCVGCCWALMGVCFVGGAAHLATMVPLAVVMAAERTTRIGVRLVRPVGVTAVLLGLVLLLGALS